MQTLTIILFDSSVALVSNTISKHKNERSDEFKILPPHMVLTYVIFIQFGNHTLGFLKVVLKLTYYQVTFTLF